jgi:hypothetical protein
MDDLLSATTSKTYVPLVDSSGAVFDEDEDTYPIGYRWLHRFCTIQAVLPRYSTFISENYAPDERRHRSQIIMNRKDVQRPETILENMLWALDNEEFENVNFENVNLECKRHPRKRIKKCRHNCSIFTYIQKNMVFIRVLDNVKSRYSGLSRICGTCIDAGPKNNGCWAVLEVGGPSKGV